MFNFSRTPLWLFVLAIITMSSENSCADFTLQHHEDETGFTTLFFHDCDTGWAGGMTYKNGKSSIILHTVDCGNTWAYSSLPDSTIETVLDMSFVSKDVGFCLAGDYPGCCTFVYSLFITRDGGEKWERVKGLPDSIVAYSFCDENNGYAGVLSADFYWRLMKTTDGGETWKEQRVENEIQHCDLFDVTCTSADICYVLYGDKNIGLGWYKLTFFDVSHDGGETWKRLYSAEETSYRTAERIVVSKSHEFVWLLNKWGFFNGEIYPGLGYSILTISNNVITSFKERPGVFGVKSFDKNEAMFFFHAHSDYDGRDCLLYTYDNGVTFEPIFIVPELYNDSYVINGFAAPDKNSAWFATTQGDIYKYEHNPDNVKASTKQPQPTVLTVYPPAPNPFNPTTTIRFFLSERSDVELTVYDCTGQKVATLVDSFMTAGNHAAVFDGSALASGVYFYRLETKDFAKTGKLMLVK